MKKLIVLATLFAGLGAFVYFYEIAGQEERERQQQLSESLFKIEDQADITSIAVQRADSAEVTLSREADNWMLKTPVEALADGSSVDALLNRITEAKTERTLEDVEDLAQYGLAEPAIRLAVTAGEKTRRLDLGSKSFNSSQQYARLDDGDVVLISTMLEGALSKDVQDWRDKRLIRFERADVEALEIMVDGRSIALEKREDDWFLTAPIEEKADQSAVSSVLSTLTSAQVDEFASESSDELAQFGLDSAQARVRIRSAGEDSWKVLEIGSDLEGRRYARDPARTQIVAVAEALSSGLNKDLLEFRDKDVVNVTQGSIVKLRLEQGEESLVLRHEDFKWFIEEPEEKKDEEALAYKFWYPIDDLEFDSIDDEEVGDFSSPDITLTLELEDGSEAKFLFVEDEQAYRARRESDGRQGRLSAEAYGKLKISAEDIV